MQIISDVKQIEQEIVVYNFEVENNHNYFVINLDILVHNDCPELYKSIKDVPKYPKDFETVQNGTTKNVVNNKKLLETLRQTAKGKLYKIYKDGYVNGKKVSIHYFQHESGMLKLK